MCSSSEKSFRIRRDHVLEEMVKGLGATTTIVEAPFDPEPRAAWWPSCMIMARKKRTYGRLVSRRPLPARAGRGARGAARESPPARAASLRSIA